MSIKKLLKIDSEDSKPSKNMIFLDFKIEQEDWNKYRLADGSLLKLKYVLMDVSMEASIEELLSRIKPGKEANLALDTKSRTLHVVQPSYKLRGKPDSKKYSAEELKEAIIEEDIDFETVKATWNLYLMDNGIRIKTRVNPISISKTDKFNQKGIPVYLFDSGIDIKIKLPEKIEAKLKKRMKIKQKNKEPKNDTVQLPDIKTK